MTQPEALRLADELEKDKWHITAVTAQGAAAELRRLYAVNQELLEALKVVLDDLEYKYHARVINVSNAAIAKAEGKT